MVNKNVNSNDKVNKYGATYLAKLAGVSRTTIYQRADKNNIELGKKLTEEQLNTLGVNDINADVNIDDNGVDTNDDVELIRLRSVNEQLNARIDELNAHLVKAEHDKDVKDSQIEKHQTALEHEQALHLSAIRQLEQAKDELKALESGEQEQETQSEKATKKRHWWQF